MSDDKNLEMTRSADPDTEAPGPERVRRRDGSPIRDPERYEILGEHGRGGLGDCPVDRTGLPVLLTR